MKPLLSLVTLCGLMIAPCVAQGQWREVRSIPVNSPSPILWSWCPAQTQTPIFPTLARLARLGQPVLWFSRDEPLTDLPEPLPSEWPRITLPATLKDVVYYRITKIKAAAKDDALVRVLQTRLRQVAAGQPQASAYVTTRGANPEVIADLELDQTVLAQIQTIVVRYLFYYPSELGTGAHLHDLESAELELTVESADQHGNPNAKLKGCQQIRATTLYGSAHGLGLYTNVLNIDDVSRDRLTDTLTEDQYQIALKRGPTINAPENAAGPASPARAPADPFWPPIVLVEEGKHASAPDRNGDGVFTPNYDVNRYAADAWGVRDTMRTRTLAPVFRADTFKQRVPEIVVKDGMLTWADEGSLRAKELFGRYVRYDYERRRASSDQEVCGDPTVLRSKKERKQSSEDYARQIRQMGGGGNPGGLLNEMHFCGDTSIYSRLNGIDVFHRLGVGGQYNDYTRFWERFSGSVRFDGGFGWTATIPIPVSVPGVGGIAVSRLAGPWQGGPATQKSIDVLYMPSASRFADWYAAAGIDHGDYSTAKDRETGKHVALELGTFLGSRIGIRANSVTSLSNARLVFEVGAGIW